jgi:asparagine synthase (glutamine-hydrolysing)
MTALAGLWDFTEKDPGPTLDRMLAAQAIYGRKTASNTLGPVALGRRLWPLTPEDAFDRGPLVSAEGSLMLIADARIDNRAELADALALTTDRISGMSDADIVLSVLEQWGADGIERLIGAFAIVCWDSEKQRLTLARDALGERPLHYHRGDGFVAVASMPKGLHAHPEIAYAANVVATADFLALVPETGDESFFEGVERVLPGHVVTIDRTSMRSRRYWNPDVSPLILESDAAYADAMRGQLDRAVACRLRRTNVAIGAHLSAGLDSSIVTATAARQLAPARLVAFTAVPTYPVADRRGEIADEGPLAAATANLHANIEHIRVASSAGSAVALMDRQFQLFERPILNPSNALWSEAINDAAQARGIGVLLTGQIGNFTISHDGFQQLPMLLRGGNWRPLFALLRRLSRRGFGVKGLAATTLGPFVSPAVWNRVSRLAGRDLPLGSYSALRTEAFDQLGVDDRAKARNFDLSYRPWADSVAMRLWGMKRVDLGVYNKGTLAGWGIDLRDPTADRRLIEFALRVPVGQYILEGVPRSLARRAFADRLPPEVIGEHRRGYQGADWHVQMAATRGDVAAELDSFVRCAGANAIIDVERLKVALDDWPEGGWHDEAIIRLYRHAMLRGVAAGHFLRKVARTN